MDELIYKGSLNSLSFGNVSYNLLREMYKSEIRVSIFPIGEKVDLEAFDSIDKDFQSWIQSMINERFNSISKDIPTLSQWHISGSESRISSHQTLFTFHELDQPTEVEKSIVRLQDNCIFSSDYSKNVFKNSGCDNVSCVNIGFDEDFLDLNLKNDNEPIHFGIMGKFEKRKNTGQIIHQWIKKFGNNYDYQLTCCIDNPFFSNEQMNGIKHQILGGQKFGNVNFLPRLKTNSEVNHFLNSIDIDLSGLSGAEGWNLPAFNATALGKWSVVMDHTSHKDWANSKNCILIQPTQTAEAYDEVFFKKGSTFNQGSINLISDDVMSEAFDKSIKKARKINESGLLLKDKFTYKKTLKNILDIIKK